MTTHDATTAAKASAAAQPGDRVLYSPDDCHSLDTTVGGDPLWAWKRESGEEVPAGDVAHFRRENGRLVDARGRPVLPVGPRAYWPATVRAVRDDGTADLDVRHPNGCVTLHYDGRRYDRGKAPGTWHHEGD